MTNSYSNYRATLYKFSYGISPKDSKRIISLVVLAHLIIFGLAKFGLPSFKLIQRPDITIEIGVAPAPSNGPSTPVASPHKSTQKEVVKEKQVFSKDPDAPSAPSPSTSSSAVASASSSSGSASAPTVDPDYKAAYLQNPKPAYPPLAFKMRVEGRVILLAEVLPNGQSGSVKIVESSGSEMLDQSALETVRRWKFTPARKDGVIVTQAVRIPITFSLKNR